MDMTQRVTRLCKIFGPRPDRDLCKGLVDYLEVSRRLYYPRSRWLRTFKISCTRSQPILGGRTNATRACVVRGML